MEYRKIGNTDMSASIIGFGGEHLDRKPYSIVKETIDAVLENGINMVDIFMPGEEVRKNIGKAIAGNREKLLIQGHIGSTDINQQYDISRDLPTCKKYFEDLLKHLGTDYIDFGMMFFIDSEKDYKNIFDTGFVTYVQQLKQQGTIRGIGFSSHNPIIAKRVIDTGIVDLMMFSINPAFDMTPASTDVLGTLDNGFEGSSYLSIDPTRAELYKLCEQKGVGITTMKTLGAGKLLSKEHTPFTEPMTVGQCIHYALSRPAVVSTLIGFQSRQQVEQGVEYLSMTDAQKDYSNIIKGFDGKFKGSCVYCSHCQPCPSEIDIAAVNKYLDIAVLNKNNIPPSIVQHYKSLNSHGSDCISCGSCEERCPFSVPIIENMKKSEIIFGL